MDFKKASLAELRQYAKDKGIRNISTLKKGELAELLENVEKLTSKKTSSNTEETKTDETKKEKVKTSKDKPQSAARNSKESTKTTKRSTKSNVKTPKREIKENTQEEENIRKSVSRPDKNESKQAVSDKKTVINPAEKKENVSAEVKGEKNEENIQREETQEAEERIEEFDTQEYDANLDSGENANGILEVMNEGYGFIRSDNYLPGDRDIYTSPQQIRKFGLKKGDIIGGPIRTKTQGEKFSALLYIKHVNGLLPSEAAKRIPFENLTPIFPNERISLDTPGAPVSIRIVDLLSPIGKGQRGMIVSPPKAGKTTLLKAIAKSISRNNPDMHLLVLLIDERPEEVTDIRESIEGSNVEVIYSTFDELPEHHKRVSEMVVGRAKRLVEHGKDVVILLDSITRLARAYNLTVPPSGRTLSGGLDPAALHMPKKFFGAARNMREGGSLTVLATALIETGSRMDDVVFEEFKGTGNMELVLDRKLSEKRIFPAIDIAKSGTRRDDLLLTPDEQEVVNGIHKMLSGTRADEQSEDILKLFVRTKNNKEFVEYMKKSMIRR
ncbi:MAG: transcription termination factor Rho [Lachnospiraceae bacterium]|nr:transcription termination factor Rho [Lachnospiraceae bacterium]